MSPESDSKIDPDVLPAVGADSNSLDVLEQTTLPVSVGVLYKSQICGNEEFDHGLAARYRFLACGVFKFRQYQLRAVLPNLMLIKITRYMVIYITVFGRTFEEHLQRP